MSETVRKLCKKTKLASRYSSDSAELNLDLQEPAQKKIHHDTDIQGSDDNDTQGPSTSQESVNLGDKDISESGLDEYPTNYMKFLLSLSQDDEPDANLDSESTSPEPDENTLSPEMNQVAEDEKNYIVDIEKVKEMLGMLHEIYPDETELVIHTRNQWGKVFYEKYPLVVQQSMQDCLLQDAIQQWRRWNVKGKTERESPFCYKCYVCNKAWWSLDELCAHIKIHNACKFKHEPSDHECNIIAYEGTPPRCKDMPIDGKCLKCGKTYDYHVTSKKLSDKFYYCNYCYRMFETCIALNKHKGICDSNPVVSENRKRLIFSDFLCRICDTELLLDSELSEHLLICHSVRSDEPIVTFSKTCWTCNEVYHDKEYHVCFKKVDSYECVFCKNEFRTKHLLNCHLKLWDGGVRCRFCCKFFMRHCMVWDHYVEHSDNFHLVHLCVVCDNIKLFETEDEWKDHRRTHHKTFYYYQERIIIAQVMLEDCLVVENTAIKANNENETTTPQIKRFSFKPAQKQTMPDVRVNLPESSCENDIFSEDCKEESQMPNTTIVHDNIVSKHNTEVPSENNAIEIKKEKDDENEPTAHNKKVPEGEHSENSNRVVVKVEHIEISEVIDLEHLEENSNSDSNIHIKKETDDDNETLKMNENVCEGDHLENSDQLIENERSTQDNLCGKENFDNQVLPNVIEQLNEFLDLKPDIVGLKEENISDDEGDLTIVETEDEPDISKILQAPSTFAEEVTENSEHSKVYQVSKSILKSETVAVKEAINKEQNDDLIVLDSSDSDEEVSGTSKGSKQNALNLKPEVILQAGYRKRKIYRCTKCDFSAYHREYKEHMDSHCKRSKTSKKFTTDSVYKCSKCSQSYPNLRKYALHFKKHGYIHLSCPQCLSRFETPTKLAYHINSHIKFQFIRISVLSDNEENCRTKSYQCKDCKKIGDTKDSFTHWESHLLLNKPDEVQLVPFKLGGRGQHALKPAALREAIAKLVEDKFKMSNCFLCNRSFPHPRRDDSKRHLIEHLLEDAFANIVDNNKLKCQICNELHAKPDHYKKHMRDHASLAIYQCSICDKCFSDSSNFTKHKKIHNLVSFECDICCKKFERKESLEKHIKWHTSSPPVTCEPCGRVFPAPSLYKKHVRAVHGGPRPLRCWFCPVTFTTYKEKAQHLWDAHKQRRKDVADCPVCARSFRTFTEVKRHALEAHGLRVTLANVWGLLQAMHAAGRDSSDDDCLVVEDEAETLIVLD